MLEDFLASLRPYADTVEIDSYALPSFLKRYWATQVFRTVGNQPQTDSPRVDVKLNGAHYWAEAVPLDATCMLVMIHSAPNGKVILVFERVMNQAHGDFFQVPVRDWTIAAAASTPHQLPPYGSNVHVASRIMLDSTFSRRG